MRQFTLEDAISGECLAVECREDFLRVRPWLEENFDSSWPVLEDAIVQLVYGLECYINGRPFSAEAAKFLDVLNLKLS